MRANSDAPRTTRRRNRKGKPARPGARVPRRLQFEPLEDRTMLAVTVVPSNPNLWTSLGPTTITGGQVEGLWNQQNTVAGAVVAFAAAPNGATVFAGTANGGVWKTTNINQTATVDVNQINDPALPQAPDASGMTAIGATLDANGAIKYRVTLLESNGVESNASQDVSFSLNPSSKTITLQNIPTESIAFYDR
jgi:hypothetical protein